MDTGQVEDSEGEDDDDTNQQGIGFIQKFRKIRDEQTSSSSSASTANGYKPASDSRFFPKTTSNNSSTGGNSATGTGSRDGGIPWLKHEMLK